MDAIIPAQAGASVTLGGSLCHTTDGFSIGPLHVYIIRVSGGGGREREKEEGVTRQ